MAEPVFFGSSRDQGKVGVDGSEVGKLAVAKQTDPFPEVPSVFRLPKGGFHAISFS